MQQEEATLWWVSPVIKEEWSICSTDHTYAKSIELLQLRANLEPLGTAEFAHTPVMMMADSGLRLGLWINVRPDRQWRICRRSQMMRHFICIPDILAGSTLGFFFCCFLFFPKKMPSRTVQKSTDSFFERNIVYSSGLTVLFGRATPGSCP